jgi:hypothetical protein
MKGFNLETSTYVIMFLTQLFLVLLLFSFRDSVRAIFELFHPAAIRKFLRTYLPRYSLRTFLIASAILPPCLALIAKPLFDTFLSGNWFFYFFLGYFVLMLGILISYCAADMFDSSPRKRWKKHLEHEPATEKPTVKLP